MKPTRPPFHWIAEGPRDFDAVHWDPEPTPNPSQEGNWHGADECLLPSWEGSGVGRYHERTPNSRPRQPGPASVSSYSSSLAER